MRFSLLSGLLLCGLSAAAQAPLVKLGSVGLPSYGTELVVNGTTAYVLTASAGQQSLRVYDVSTPAAPQLQSTLALPAYGFFPPLPPRHAAYSNGRLLVSSYPTTTTLPPSMTTWLLDVSNPTRPSVITTGFANGSTELFVALSGNYRYQLLDNSSLLYVYDTSSSSPRTVNLPYSLSSILGLTANGNTVYVQYGNGTFATIDITTPGAPVSSAGTMAGTIGAASGTLGAGLAQPAHANSVPGNALRVYSLSNPLQPALVRSLPGNNGTRVAAGGQSVFTMGATNPYLPAAPSSAEPLRGYFFPAGGGAPVAAIDTSASSQGANALAVVSNRAYVLTDASLSIYAFPATVTATRAAARPPLPLYPNPAQGALFLPQLAPGTPIAVYDATGRCCLRAAQPAQGPLDIRALPAGLYQVHAGPATSKLVVE